MKTFLKNSRGRKCLARLALCVFAVPACTTAPGKLDHAAGTGRIVVLQRAMRPGPVVDHESLDVIHGPGIFIRDGEPRLVGTG
jgi:hypothetical protein